MPATRISTIVVCGFLLLLDERHAQLRISASESPTAVRFSRDIRPLLSDRCFRCHGPDGATRQADLRLDQKEMVLGERDNGRIVVPGDPGASELIRRITSSDEDERMPPPDCGISLSADEIERIRSWVEQGGHWESHWAWITPHRPEPPRVHREDRVRNPIDRFVTKRLESAGLSPSPEADKRTLLRRVTQDLTGLPPTREEIAAFLADKRPDAFEHVVDRLLNSTRFGETMSLPWLEATRYADTSGYTEDYGRYMYPWRTWVIRAFNNNKPFDEFLTEQMAGDLLPNPTHDQILATAFHRHHRINQEVGALPEEFIVEYAVDRLETVGTVFLGTTIGCARCHDHKYDPFSQKEFYQLLAFVNNNSDGGLDHQSRFGFCRPFIDHPTSPQQAELDRLESAVATLKAGGPDSKSELPAFEKWVREALPEELLGLSSWYSLGPFDHEKPTRVTGFRNPYFAEPAVDLNEVVEGQRWTEQPERPIGKFIVPGGEYSTIYLFREVYSSQAGDVTFGIGVSDSICIWINGQLFLDRLEAGTNNAVPNPMVLPLRNGRNELLIKMSNGDFGQQITFRLEEHGNVPPDLFAILRRNSSDHSTEDRQRLRGHFHSVRVTELQQKIRDVDRQVAKVMIMKEREDVRPTHILARGSYAQPQEQVDCDVPSALPPLPEGAPKNRLGLAQWLVSPDHPLTARVTVNRFWRKYFGAGLVRTPEDFGAQGEYPTHPDLLDWLATEFIRSEWDVKHMQRLIITSTTYRQSSSVNGESLRRDPENRLLTRGIRFRLRPQEIRDQALFVSGLLVERMEGPSVKPYQPARLWREFANLNLVPEWFLTVEYEQDHGESLYRRSLYTFWKRSMPPPNMTVFDAESREVCSVRREASNTPLQALNLLNDVTYVETARHLAHRILTEGGESTEERLICGMEMVSSRRPTPGEVDHLHTGLREVLEEYRRNPDRADILLRHGESPISDNQDPVELAAWTQLALTLLNLDEALTRQ